MNKKIRLISVTAVVIAVSYIISAVIIMRVPEVTIFSLNPQTVSSSVVCGGKIEYCGGKGEVSEYDGIVTELYVSEGERVSRGDKLYTLSILPREQTALNNYLSGADESELERLLLSGEYSSLDEYYGEGIVLSESSDDAEIPLSQTTVYSSADGVISNLDIKSGSRISAGEKTMSISDAGKIQARLEVGEDKIGKIEIGQSVRITCNALNGTIMRGTVSKIGEIAKQTSGVLGKETTVEVIVGIDDGITADVKPGYTVKCSITVEKKDNALLLPYESIKYDDSGNEYVLCYSQSGICEKKNVKTGNEYKDGIEIVSGVTGKDLIVSAPAEIDDDSFAKIAGGANG